MVLKYYGSLSFLRRFFRSIPVANLRHSFCFKELQNLKYGKKSINRNRKDFNENGGYNAKFQAAAVHFSLCRARRGYCMSKKSGPFSNRDYTVEIWQDTRCRVGQKSLHMYQLIRVRKCERNAGSPSIYTLNIMI